MAFKFAGTATVFEQGILVAKFRDDALGLRLAVSLADTAELAGASDTPLAQADAANQLPLDLSNQQDSAMAGYLEKLQEQAKTDLAPFQNGHRALETIWSFAERGAALPRQLDRSERYRLIAKPRGRNLPKLNAALAAAL